VKRTTVFLEESLLRRARQFARREGRSLAQVVREALAHYVGTAPGHRRALPSVTGMFDSGHTDTSERVDELLWRDPHG
jgi:hypothetical protein